MFTGMTLSDYIQLYTLIVYIFMAIITYKTYTDNKNKK